MAGQGRILVIRGGAIGDFILTLPALAALRAGLPGARIEVLGYPHIAGLALAGGLADAVHSIEAGPLAGFFARGGSLSPRWRDFFSDFAVICSFLYDPDGIFRENVALCSRAQFIAGPHRPDEAAGLHATRVFLQPLERLAIFEADEVPRLKLEPSGPGGRKGGQRAQLAVHPGSGSERKNWPENRWVELLRLLSATGRMEFLVVGGEAEGEKLERLASILPQGRVRLARSLPLVELAGRLAGCAGFVGHDSGISHLAAALGVPTLALWGETAQAIWRPRGQHVRILRSAQGLGGLEVETVARTITEMGWGNAGV